MNLKHAFGPEALQDLNLRGWKSIKKHLQDEFIIELICCLPRQSGGILINLGLWHSV